MKAAITERRPNGDVVSIEIEPLVAGRPTHTIKCTRTFTEDRTKQISRFTVDSEGDAWNFIRAVTEDRCNMGINDSVLKAWQNNNLNEVLA